MTKIHSVCIFCSLPASTENGNHNSYADCLKAKDAKYLRDQEKLAHILEHEQELDDEQVELLIRNAC